MRRLVSAAALGLAANLVAPAGAATRQQPPSPSPSPGRMFEARATATPSPELCSLLARCGLTVELGFCTAAMSAGVNGVTYDEARCVEARDLRAVQPLRGIAFPDADQLIGRRIGQGPQEYAIEDAEDCGVDANGQAQRQDDDGCKPTVRCKEPDGFSEIRFHGAHRLPHPRSLSPVPG